MSSFALLVLLALSVLRQASLKYCLHADWLLPDSCMVLHCLNSHKAMLLAANTGLKLHEQSTLPQQDVLPFLPAPFSLSLDAVNNCCALPGAKFT